MYRLFIDEVGHDNLKSAGDPNEQYLCLMGVILDLDRAHQDLTNAMAGLKIDIFGTAKVILHRREIIDKNPPFDRLNDLRTKRRFDEGLISIFTNCDYTALTVLIDKKEHVERYRVWKSHPYHYCLKAMLERYVMCLNERNGIGDVMAEWRGIKPNMKLEAAYRFIYRNGTEFMPVGEFQRRLSSGELKIRKKEANIAGLQLSDLLASPACRQLICERRGEDMTAPFGRQVVKILQDLKYHRNWRGVVRGIGTKCLP
jgi:Protein of unknown function (DUF3800)